MVETVRPVFVETARRAVALVEHEAVAVAWTEPSALVGYAIGGLATHLCRAVLTVDGYLDGDSVDSPASELSAAEYFAAALDDHDPVDSGHHQAIRQRSSDMAASGMVEVVQATEDALDRLAGRLPEIAPNHVVSVFGGLTMALDEYLRTRIVELCVHADDLGASIDGLDIELPDASWRITREVLADLAALRLGDQAVALGLSRRERAERPLAL